MRKIKTRELVLCAIFAALSSVLSQISIPIGLVPINLTHVSVFMAAGLLGSKLGAFSQLVFVIMGAIGLPVFSGFSGGLGVVFGSTGGYILAYVGTAFITGFIVERFGKSTKFLIIAMCSGWLVTYVFGTAWYSIMANIGFIEALSICILPFIPGDLLKTIICIFLINKMNRY